MNPSASHTCDRTRSSPPETTSTPRNCRQRATRDPAYAAIAVVTRSRSPTSRRDSFITAPVHHERAADICVFRPQGDQERSRRTLDDGTLTR